jgi:ketopantoate hydroxymethyltransferase
MLDEGGRFSGANANGALFHRRPRTVIQRHDTTLPVSIEEMEYRARGGACGNSRAWIIADMPFASYHESLHAMQRS